MATTATNINKDSSQYLLYNVDNYNKTINKPIQEILTKFADIMIEYMVLIIEKISMKKKKHFLFIFERGIETIIHVFSMLFFYTKNIDLTFYHTQKAYYFYIEFIQQISDDNITFLQLSSRDAVMFVYKKTIYDINNEHKKNIMKLIPEDEEVLEILNLYVIIFKKNIHFLIHHPDFAYDKKKEIITIFCDKFRLLNNNLIKGKIKLNSIKCIYSYAQLLTMNLINMTDFYNCLEEFIVTIQTKKKTPEDIGVINKNISFCNVNKFIEDNGIMKLNNYIFSAS